MKTLHGILCCLAVALLAAFTILNAARVDAHSGVHTTEAYYNGVYSSCSGGCCQMTGTGSPVTASVTVAHLCDTYTNKTDGIRWRPNGGGVGTAAWHMEPVETPTPTVTPTITATPSTTPTSTP